MSMTYVVDGAKIKCSKGVGVSTVSKGVDCNIELHSKKMLNVADSKPNINIKPFKSCKSGSNPSAKDKDNKLSSSSLSKNSKVRECGAVCNPSICMKWVKGKSDVYVNGELALTSESTLTCMYGGIIKILDDGQRK